MHYGFQTFAGPLNQHYWSLGRSLAGLWDRQQIIPMHVYEVVPKKVGALKNWHPWVDAAATMGPKSAGPSWILLLLLMQIRYCYLIYNHTFLCLDG